jgi:hypothetical protein
MEMLEAEHLSQGKTSMGAPLQNLKQTQSERPDQTLGVAKNASSIVRMLVLADLLCVKGLACQ